MWSVKYRPKPGLARISARRDSEVGAGFGMWVKEGVDDALMCAR
jgi:hypothetical protein